MILMHFIAAVGLMCPAQDSADGLQFEVVQPEGASGPRPVLLALPPGAQDDRMVEAGLRLYWREEALRRGWTVVSPASGDGGRLEPSELLELLTKIEERFEPEYGRVHLAGVSNGGRSAVALALAAPERFASLSLLPGMPKDTSPDALGVLVGLPLAMYVGGDDGPWREAMEAVAKTLTDLGSPPAVFNIFEGEGHTPKSLSPGQLFDNL